MKFHTLVVDDEPLARKRIVDLLKNDRTIEIADECKNGYEAIKHLHAQSCDLLFLDIQMPDIDGFGVLESLEKSKMPATIFVTAYDQYAMKAFSVNAIDYLLKPFDDDQFYKCLTDAKLGILHHRIGEMERQLKSLSRYMHDHDLCYGAIPGAPEGVKTPYHEQFAIKNNGKIFFMKTSTIQWIEATGNYVCFHTSKGRHLLRATIHSMCQKLDPKIFIRVHRSFIVNTEFIQEMEVGLHGEYSFLMEKGEKIVSGRNYHSNVSKYLKIND